MEKIELSFSICSSMSENPQQTFINFIANNQREHQKKRHQNFRTKYQRNKIINPIAQFQQTTPLLFNSNTSFSNQIVYATNFNQNQILDAFSSQKFIIDQISQQQMEQFYYCQSCDQKAESLQAHCCFQLLNNILYINYRLEKVKNMANKANCSLFDTYLYLALNSRNINVLCSAKNTLNALSSMPMSETQDVIMTRISNLISKKIKYLR